MITVAEAIRILGGPRAEALARQIEHIVRLRHEELRGTLRDVRRPITLRDVRRAIHHSRSVGHSKGGDVFFVAAPAIALLGENVKSSPWEKENAQAVDRLISRYGPDFELESLLDAYFERGTDLAQALFPRVVERLAKEGWDESMTDIAARVEMLEAERELAKRQDHTTGTDRVVENPIGVENADAHGGDGNSGEMDHRAKTSATDRRASESAACGAAEDTPDGTPEANRAATDCNAGGQTVANGAPTREDGGKPTCQGAYGGDEPTREMGTQLAAIQADADKGTAGDSSSALGDGTDCGQDTSDATAIKAQGESQFLGHHAKAGAANGSNLESVAHGDAETPGATDTDQYGGSYFTDPAVLALREKRAMREAANLLRRIIETEIGARGRETPRIDARALVRELVSRRSLIERARRHEAEIKELILVVDESASCSAVVNTLYAAAIAIARNLPSGKASVILHSNGYCVRVADGAPCAPWLKKEIVARASLLSRHYYAASQRDASAEIWHAIAKRRPGLVIAMGDHDADWMLNILRDAGTNLIAIHHHAVDPFYDGIRRIGPASDALSAAASLRKFFTSRFWRSQ